MRLQCLRCRSYNLGRSGKEPQRQVCGDCGANYHVTLSIVEVPPDEVEELEPLLVESSEGTEEGS